MARILAAESVAGSDTAPAASAGGTRVAEGWVGV